MTLDAWPDFAVRQAEGWDIFECDGVEHAPYEIEKNDCIEVPGMHEFDTDDEAWAHVVSCAAAGRGTHLRALAFLALYSCEELIGITYALYHGEYRTYLPRKAA